MRYNSPGLEGSLPSNKLFRSSKPLFTVSASKPKAENKAVNLDFNCCLDLEELRDLIAPAIFSFLFLFGTFTTSPSSFSCCKNSGSFWKLAIAAFIAGSLSSGTTKAVSSIFSPSLTLSFTVSSITSE